MTRFRIPVSILNCSRSVGSIAIAATAIMGLSACESETERNLGEAQACLDRASEVTAVNACLEKIANDKSPSAYLLRCTGHFVAQGLDSARITKAFEGMSSSSNGSNADPTMMLMAYLVLPKSGADYANHTPQVTVSDCQASEASSLYRIALVAQAATLLAGTGIDGSALDPSNPNFNPTAPGGLQDRIATLIGSPSTETNTELGGIVLAVNSVYCAEGSSFKEEDLCKDVASAISTGGGVPENIGAALLQRLQPPTP